MKLFLSKFIHKVDKKGRVSLPSSFRQVLSKKEDGTDFALVRSFQKPALEGLTMDRVERLTEVIDGIGVYSQQQQDLAAVLLADSKLMSLDTDGRIILTDELMAYANIRDKAIFVGKGHTFEIWEPSAYELVLDGARKRLNDSNVSLALGQLSSTVKGS